jgi:phosphohistidine phosphatase
VELFIIRHAWAAERGDRWPDDARRPLTDEGRQRFARVAGLLADCGVAPGIIATSPMLRCVETAEILAKALAGKASVVEQEELLPGGDPKLLLAWTEKHAGKSEQMAWVGHAPDVEYLAAALIGRDEGRIHFSKGSIAAVRFKGPPELGRGELRWLATAKILGC